MRKLLVLILMIVLSVSFAVGQDCEISGLWVGFANSWIEGGETVYEYTGVFEGQEVSYEEREYWYFTEDGSVAKKWVSITDNEEDEWNWGHYEIDNDSITISGIGEGNKLGFTLQEVSDFPEGAEYQHSGCMLSLEEPSEDEWTRNFLSTDTEGLKSDIDDMETPTIPVEGLWMNLVTTNTEDSAWYEIPGILEGQKPDGYKWRYAFYFNSEYKVMGRAWFEEGTSAEEIGWEWFNYEVEPDSLGTYDDGSLVWKYGLSRQSVTDFPPIEEITHKYNGSVLQLHGPDWGAEGEGKILNLAEVLNADSIQSDIDSTMIPTVPEEFTSVENTGAAKPDNYKLSQNYPNPFNPVTTIDYNLPKQSQVKITVYNMLGEKVEELINEVKPAGYNTVQWNASGFSSGLYFYRIKAGNFTSVKKCILVK